MEILGGTLNYGIREKTEYQSKMTNSKIRNIQRTINIRELLRKHPEGMRIAQINHILKIDVGTIGDLLSKMVDTYEEDDGKIYLK